MNFYDAIAHANEFITGIGGNSTSSRLNRNDKVYGDLFKVNIILDLSKKDCYNIPVKYLMQDVKPFIESLKILIGQ